MRPETYDVYELLTDAAGRTGVPWISCTAVEAHRRFHGLEPEPVRLELDGLGVRTDRPPFQAAPFFAAELDDGRFVRLYPKQVAGHEWRVDVDPARLRRYGAAVTSRSGDKTVALSQ
jgi:hypothetical protein